MLRRSAPLLLAVALPTAAYVGCGADSSTFDLKPDASSGASGNSSGAFEPGPKRDGGSSGSPFGPGCGNSYVEEGEVCDDGNTKSTDGCASDCKLVEAGYQCASEGAACAALCGDAVKLGDEDCDDGNTKGDDGCSEGCRLEVGFKCPSVGAACVATVCGDGAVEGTEQCDDTVLANGADRPFDSCYQCVKEPLCGANGCTGACGDGLLFPNEACDDGNTRDGDGCSATCTPEVGFTCENRTEDLPPALIVPVVYRDLQAIDTPDDGHPDFESFKGYGAYRDLVKAALGADGTPEFNKASAAATPCVTSDLAKCGELQQLTSAADFNDWYHDTARTMPVVSTLSLAQRSPGVYAFDSKEAPYGEVTYANNKKAGIFFPLDPVHNDGQSVGWGIQTGNACRVFDSNAPSSRTCADPIGTLHNFHFTSELRFNFTYQDPGNDADGPVLNFTGDDDVWIFINGQRVVDLGGLHSVMGDNDVRGDGGTVVLNRARAQTLGLVDKNVYQIALFHAERRTEASNFKLTLGGFLKTRTFCAPVCGDGVKTKNETCDNGEQNGSGYGQCTTECKWGPRCGDGIVQAGEACDDGNFKEKDACNPDCTIPPGVD